MPTISARTFVAAVASLTLVTTPVAAQPGAQPPAVTVSGTGTEKTYVLLSGMVGGVKGFGRIEALLLERGYRVIAIDPYQLSLDSTDATFAALARRVDRVLEERGVASARIVGHSHGGGVALRLAANAPRRVEALYLLDVGAMETQQGVVFSSAMRLVPLIARLPGGRGFIRDRFLSGLRQNSGTHAWLDSATQRAYTEPLLNNIGRVIAMAMRLSRAEEPEPLSSVMDRLDAPVTVLLGAVANPSEPDAAEIGRLAMLKSPVHIAHLAGVGHFPHEESPREVVRFLVIPRTVAALPRLGGA